MAKRIKDTPTLNKEDLKNFLQEQKKPLSKEEKEYNKKVKNHRMVTF